jgi:hypothetical protein
VRYERVPVDPFTVPPGAETAAQPRSRIGE